MPMPAFAVVLVSDRSGRMHSQTLCDPTLGSLTNALSETIGKFDSVSSVAFVQVSYDGPIGKRILSENEGAENASGLATLFWAEMLFSLGVPSIYLPQSSMAGGGNQGERLAG